MSNLGKNFYPKLVQISSELGMKPEDLLAVMVSESGINPSAHEQKYNGGGLLGFMPSTLKGLQFKGSPEDFRELSGEQQLSWVKKLVQSYMGFNGGKPFKSAAQYYIANFVPAALGLPGVRAENPNYAFLEAHPATVKDPKTGKLLSKKYYDIGVSLPADNEKLFYDTNPLFHGSTQGAITYGDMVKQVDKNKNSSTYSKALADMKGSTGYQPSEHLPAADNKGSRFGDFFAKLQRLLSQFSIASAPTSNFLISVGSSKDYISTMEYARILSAAIEDYLQIKTVICADNSNIEIQCKIKGDKKQLCDALKELSNGVSEAFVHAHSYIEPITTFALVMVDNKSEYNILPPRLADLYCRRFKLKCLRK